MFPPLADPLSVAATTGPGSVFRRLPKSEALGDSVRLTPLGPNGFHSSFSKEMYNVFFLDNSLVLVYTVYNLCGFSLKGIEFEPDKEDLYGEATL